jgi:hypothetical protein
MSNRRRTSSELSLEIIDILKIIQTKSKPIEIKIKRRTREQDCRQNTAKSPNPNDYENIEGIFIHRRKTKEKRNI